VTDPDNADTHAVEIVMAAKPDYIDAALKAIIRMRLGGVLSA
jgi:hypothetical protein